MPPLRVPAHFRHVRWRLPIMESQPDFGWMMFDRIACCVLLGLLCIALCIMASASVEGHLCIYLWKSLCLCVCHVLLVRCCAWVSMRVVAGPRVPARWAQWKAGGQACLSRCVAGVMTLLCVDVLDAVGGTSMCWLYRSRSSGVGGLPGRGLLSWAKRCQCDSRSFVRMPGGWSMGAHCSVLYCSHRNWWAGARALVLLQLLAVPLSALHGVSHRLRGVREANVFGEVSAWYRRIGMGERGTLTPLQRGCQVGLPTDYQWVTNPGSLEGNTTRVEDREFIRGDPDWLDHDGRAHTTLALRSPGRCWGCVGRGTAWQLASWLAPALSGSRAFSCTVWQTLGVAGSGAKPLGDSALADDVGLGHGWQRGSLAIAGGFRVTDGDASRTCMAAVNRRAPCAHSHVTGLITAAPIPDGVRSHTGLLFVLVPPVRSAVCRCMRYRVHPHCYDLYHSVV